MPAEQKNRPLGSPVEQHILSRIPDIERAIAALGLSEAVIQKFSDQLNLADYLAQIRSGMLGHEYATQTPPEQDPVETQTWIREEAGHSLRRSSVNHEGLMHHSDPAVRKFGRRMYLELNPDNYSPDQLAALKQEWKI